MSLGIIGHPFLYFSLDGDRSLSKRENAFQAKLISDLKDIFPGCVILKNDPNYLQGVPDILILYNDRWAMLECKRDAKASHRPNQEYYIDKLGEMSYAAFIYPENREDILDELQHALGVRGTACVS